MKTNSETKPVKKENINTIDYKNPEFLKSFLSPRFKLLPRKLTRLSAKKQRLLQREIKKSRMMGLIPFTDTHAID